MFSLGKYISYSNRRKSFEILKGIQKFTTQEIQVKCNKIRFLSTAEQTKVHPLQPTTLISKEEIQKFMAVFPQIVRDITDSRKEQLPTENMKRIVETLEYIVLPGKKVRPLISIMAYKMLEKPERLTSENIKLCRILGWCMELMQCSILIIDDILDRSLTRRGQPCWYRQPGIGLSAINDAEIMQHDTYLLLKKYFSHHPLYVSLVEVFHDTILKVYLGQMIDSSCCPENGKAKVDMFTMDRYTTMGMYKTSYYTFYLPVALAMYLANITDKTAHREATTVLIKIGNFYQVQNDFLDCFGNPSKTGKVGTDIEEGKFTWLAIMALQNSSPAQRKLMEEHYGKPTPESVAIIRQLYEDLDLPKKYANYETEWHKHISALIPQIVKELPHELFYKILTAVYKISN